MSTTTTIRERPILMSAPMIRALLAGRKTQTRRIAKPPAKANFLPDDLWKIDVDEPGSAYLDDESGRLRIDCPFGKPGDRLWCRETFALAGWTEDTWMGGREYEDWDGVIPKQRESLLVGYRADGDDCDQKWRPSIFMPRWASRITLEISDVRVERLQAISEADAIAEGCDVRLLGETIRPLESAAKAKPLHWVDGDDAGGSYCRKCASRRVRHLRASEPESRASVDGGWIGEEDGQQWCESCGVILDCSYTDHGVQDELEHLEETGIRSAEDGYIAANVISLHGNPWLTESCGDWDYKPEWKGRIARLCFRTIWDKLNAGREYSWESNPWVWRIAFRRIDP
jgi:hypothetical protein